MAKNDREALMEAFRKSRKRRVPGSNTTYKPAKQGTPTKAARFPAFPRGNEGANATFNRSVVPPPGGPVPRRKRRLSRFQTTPYTSRYPGHPYSNKRD